MAIGKSKLHEMLRRGSRLSDLEAFKQASRNKRVSVSLVSGIRQRLQKGLMPDGSPIKNKETGSSTYSASTVEAYERIGRYIDDGQPYTMKYTGKFYDSIKTINFADRIEAVSDPIKENDNLYEKYGRELVHFSEENKNRLIPIFKTLYIEYYRKTLFGTI